MKHGNMNAERDCSKFKLYLPCYCTKKVLPEDPTSGVRGVIFVMGLHLPSAPTSTPAMDTKHTRQLE